MGDLVRCAWAEGDPVMQAYHDAEWGVPQRDSRMLWEMLMLEGFQAGLSWQVIPSELPRLMSQPDAAAAGRVFQAMMGMDKIVIAALEAAAQPTE